MVENAKPAAMRPSTRDGKSASKTSIDLHGFTTCPALLAGGCQLPRLNPDSPASFAIQWAVPDSVQVKYDDVSHGREQIPMPCQDIFNGKGTWVC